MTATPGRPRRSLLALAATLALATGACRTSAPATAKPSVVAADERTAPPLPMVWPELLAPGATIMFVAPAGALDRERMERAKERLGELGYRVVARDDLYSEEGFLAGDDERRAAELMQAFLDPEVDAILSGTGGYGTMRILARLDYEAIRAHPKIFIGFSDITGLHAALVRRAGIVTFHAPMPAYLFGGEEPPAAFALDGFFRALGRPAAGESCDFTVTIPPEAPQPASWGHGKARGRLVGGNLSLVAALEGTPYAFRTDGAILLLEDLREAPYRVDRMLRQLELAGRLDHLAGVVLGQFTREFDREDAPRDPDPRYTTNGVLEQYFAERGIPVLWNFPVGHHPMNATLPEGGVVEIDADRKTLTVLRSADGACVSPPGG
ncbi:MAG: LD-carboxypeptidase [Thermoanaerobaculia bacterium]